MRGGGVRIYISDHLYQYGTGMLKAFRQSEDRDYLKMHRIVSMPWSGVAAP